MTKPSLGARQGAMLRYMADHPGCEALDLVEGVGESRRAMAPYRRATRLITLGLATWGAGKGDNWGWNLTDAGWEWLASRANPVVRPAPAKRLVVGRRMRAAVQYVAKHEGCTKYAAGKAVTRPGHQRDGWVIVQRAIDAGLLAQRKRRDGTTALSVTDKGWAS